MKPLAKVAVGCGVVAGLGVVAIAGLVGFLAFKKARHDKAAVPFIETYLKELAHWDPARVEMYWAPEVLDQLEREKVARLFLAYQALGDLESHDPPSFRQVGTHTGVPYPELVTYQVSARYAAGPALITLQLVKSKSGEYRVWYIFIHSEAFLPQLDADAAAPKPVL